MRADYKSARAGNISCRIANANTQCGRITNPPERAPDGKTVIDNAPGKGPGEWVTYRNGRKPVINATYPGIDNLKPGTANFKYNHTYL